MTHYNDEIINLFLYLDNQFKQNKLNTNIQKRKKDIQKICERRILNYNKKDCEIVIAKYLEDLSWCSKYKHLITVYDKSDKPIEDSVNLPNVGRESHTYLYHIIKNWNSLADNTLFTQGGFTPDHNPFPLETYLIKKKEIKLFINLYNRGIDFRGKSGEYLKHRFKWLEEFNSGYMRPAGITFDQFWSLFNINPIKNYDSIIWSHGAIFSISKELIKSQPLNLYIKLYHLLNNHQNPEEGHYFERSWYYIFYSKSSNLGHSSNSSLKLNIKEETQYKYKDSNDEDQPISSKKTNSNIINNKILVQNNYFRIEQIDNF